MAPIKSIEYVRVPPRWLFAKITDDHGRAHKAMAGQLAKLMEPHCPLGPISLAASVQVDMVMPNFCIQEMSLGIHYNAMVGNENLTSHIKNPETWDPVDGYIGILRAPGLGIEVDEDKMRESWKNCEIWITPGFDGPGGEIREWQFQFEV